MRYVTALFDAPIPARAAAAALASAGFHPDDIALVPHLAGAPAAGWFVDADPADARGVRQALEDLGFDAADAGRAAEGARRGAIILMVRTPTLSAPIAAEVIAALAPPDPEALAATWEADPSLKFDWAAVPPPGGNIVPVPVLVVDDDEPAADDGVLVTVDDVPVAHDDEPAADDGVLVTVDDDPAADDDDPAPASDPGHGPDTPDDSDPELRRPGS